ncbi:hypothetical protein KY285_014200 [Solanum tuberosum]|nr:hypothetical protein KY285_014200 [Solanum tuberosum]
MSSAAKPEMGSQCISLLYGNGERTLDLTCKDKMQAETWFVGLRAIISRTHHHKIVDPLKSNRRAHSSISSRAGYTRRKQNLGLSAKTIRPSQVESLERLCETRKEKIQESTKVEEAWSVAKEEASKGKAAKEVVKALTSRVTTL